MARGAVFAAVDIGASSGRVVAGISDGDGFRTEIIHRFPNGAKQRDGHLRWNLTGLYAEVEWGLQALASMHPDVTSIGIDTWAVDYALLDGEGRLLAEPVAYRDDRTDAVIDHVDRRLSRQRQYEISGLQFLPFNTLYQLAAEQRAEHWSRVAHAVMLPDLLAYWLTGRLRTEATNASTTGLFDARARSWSADAFRRARAPARPLPAADRTGGDPGADHRRRRGPDRFARDDDRHRCRDARHRLGGGGGAGTRTRHRLRVVRDLVPGRARAGRAGDHR